jgi:flagellar export protein FliJ
MAFQFTLRGLLRLRLSLEKAELQKLQAIAGEVMRVRAEVESVQEQKDALRRRTHDALVSEGLTAAEWHFEMAQEASLEELLSELVETLADLEEKRKLQQARYLKARMQREILTSLRERQLAQYNLEESRRAQQRVDELFLIRSISPAEK